MRTDLRNGDVIVCYPSDTPLCNIGNSRLSGDYGSNDGTKGENVRYTDENSC